MVLNKSKSKQVLAQQGGLTRRKEIFVGSMEKKPKVDEGRNYSHRSKNNKNMCVLLEEGGIPKANPSKHCMVGMHHLFCNKDRQLIGFRGIGFSDSVIIGTENLGGPPSWLVEVESHEDYNEAKCMNSVYGNDDLMASDNMSDFLIDNQAIFLSPRELTKAINSIEKSTVVDPCLYGQLQGGGQDTNTINPVSLLTYLKNSSTIEVKLDRLISFLWATVKGYNNAFNVLKEARMTTKIAFLEGEFQTWEASWVHKVHFPPVVDDLMAQVVLPPAPKNKTAGVGRPDSPVEPFDLEEENREDKDNKRRNRERSKMRRKERKRSGGGKRRRRSRN